jgi:hypothetical protein
MSHLPLPAKPHYWGGRANGSVSDYHDEILHGLVRDKGAARLVKQVLNQIL